MSSTSRSPDEKAASTDERASERAHGPEKKAGSPGRYSLADDAGAVPSTRIDSTSRMPAVRVDTPVKSAVDGAPASSLGAVAEPAASAEASKKAPAVAPFGALPKGRSTERAMPASQARAPAAAAPSSQRAPLAPASRPEIPATTPATPSSQRLPAAGASPGDADGPETKKSADAKPLPPKLPPGKSAAKPPPPRAPSRKASSPPSANAASQGPVAKSDPDASPIPDGPAPLDHDPASKPVREGDVAASALDVGSLPDALSLDALSLDELDEGSIAFAFDALVSEDRASQPGTHEFDLAPVRELFAALAANHMRHVRDFMIDVKWGEVTRDWIHICLPPVRTLRRAAERLDLVELGDALEKLGAELDAANAVGGRMLDANEKQVLLATYESLVTILPQAFALDRDKTQREGVIVQALLLQVPDVRKVTIDKLQAAGLTSLNEFFAANAHDIAHVAGIPEALATKIVERVEAYRAELQASSPQDARAAERDKLAALNGRLKEQHDAYERASDGWGPDAKAQRREHFLAREETWLAISVLLARFGEVDRLQGIEKVPFVRRITQLTEYLEEARDKYRADA